MASESKPDHWTDGSSVMPREYQGHEIREKLLAAIRSDPSTPLTQSDWDEMRKELRRRHAERRGGPMAGKEPWIVKSRRAEHQGRAGAASSRALSCWTLAPCWWAATISCHMAE
jgi:hypothetical protein